jgi:hypothetical protein
MARRISRPVHVVVAWLFVIGLLYQVFLAGLGVFDSSTAFLTHRDTGYVLTFVPVLLAVTGFLGRFGWLQVGAALFMVVQFILQSVFVLQRDSMPAVAALHPVNGVLILVIAVWLASDAWRRFNADEGPAPAEAAAAPEQEGA